MKAWTGTTVITLLIVSFSLTDCSLPPLDKIVDEIHTISKYVDGHSKKSSLYKWWKYADDPELYMTTPEIIRKEGYPAEAHVVLTDDGYLLTMHRIPGPPNSPIAFLQHGLLASSSDWVITGKNRALAFILADMGYDVWMGNARGNTYSKSHINYTTSDLKFWNFSWNEMAIYDLPAELSYITNIKKDKMIYIGHSMGTTMFFAMSIDKPDVASNIKAMFGLAPVAFLNHIKSPVRLLVPFLPELELIIRFLGEGEFLPQNSIIKFLAKYGCDIDVTEEKICANTLFVICGFDTLQFNYTLLPRILYHSPAGASTKTLIHFAQEIKSGRFQRYDYGAEVNKKLYHNSTVPDYDLTKVQVPVGLFWAENDWLASPIDVQKLSDLLPNNILNRKVDYPTFNHLDFMWAVDVPKLVYKDLIIAMNKYR
ncbi:lipase 3-like [Phymastichus coffea]|uniref:lipase 3-like n=1 Tax=Phymastichus coffea TaxID=108790 RepID=UPI00273BD4FF|nr:lipase 3-like [Phymastichus coffea]XP_058789332.1 lipase 3-like [Phymastichus coffea]